MIIGQPSEFVSNFIEEINEGLQEVKNGAELSMTQRWWLSFCITACLVTDSVCFAKFVRCSICPVFRFKSYPGCFVVLKYVGINF